MPRTTSMIFGLVAFIAVFVLYRYTDQYSSANTASATVEKQGIFADWKDYTAESGKFKAQFPLVPRHISESSQDPRSHALRRYNIYISEQLDSTVYMITSVNFTDKFNPEKDDRILAETVTNMVSSQAKNTLASMDETTFQGRKALRFKIDNDKTNEIVGLAFVADKTLYVLTRISKNNNSNNEEFDHFVKAFSVTPASVETAQPNSLETPKK